MRLLARYLPAFAIFGTVTALAAPDPTGPQTAPAPAGPPAAAALSPAEMRTRAEQIKTRIDEDVRYVLHLKEIAKKKQDVIKLNCVNDRLVEIKAQQNMADNANAQLRDALDNNGDRVGAFGQLDSTGNQIHTLREQANACIGEPELFKQESGVEVEAPEIPDDPTLNPFEPEVEAPGYASPYD